MSYGNSSGAVQERFFAALRGCDFISETTIFFASKLNVFSATFCEKSINSQPLRMTTKKLEIIGEGVRGTK